MGAGSEKKRKRAEDASSSARKKANTLAPVQQPQSIKVTSVKSVRTCPPVIGRKPTHVTTPWM
jgi:hypothetical protein